MQQIYEGVNSDYLQLNNTWHVEDSPWKATQIIKMINRNKILIKSVVEIGCGAGEILNQLHNRLPDNTITFEGYDIATDAHKLALQREKERIKFYLKNLLLEKNKHYDLLLMIDVFEHVEDAYSFVRECAKKATYKIYHIPLDLTASYLIRNKLLDVKKSVGHINYYTKDTALAFLTDTDQEIIDFFYTPTSGESKKIKTKLMNIPRRILFSIAPDFCVRVLGGYSLMVLTK